MGQERFRTDSERSRGGEAAGDENSALFRGARPGSELRADPGLPERPDGASQAAWRARQALLRLAYLENRVNELVATNQDQDRRLRNSEQYLSSDRDIRELMGARNLYIADVFDVDSSSRTRKPFGRVFYTRGKSLIFYAYDLDRRPAVRDASAFQVWGRRKPFRASKPSL